MTDERPTPPWERAGYSQAEWSRAYRSAVKLRLSANAELEAFYDATEFIGGPSWFDTNTELTFAVDEADRLARRVREGDPEAVAEFIDEDGPE